MCVDDSAFSRFIVCAVYNTSCYNNIHGQRVVEELFNSLLPAVERRYHYYYNSIRSKDASARRSEKETFVFSHFASECTRREVKIILNRIETYERFSQ